MKHHFISIQWFSLGLILNSLLGFYSCAGMDVVQNKFPVKGWSFSPEVIQKDNLEGIKEKYHFYNTYSIKPDSKPGQDTSQIEKECIEKAKKENSDDLISDMISDIVEPSPVIKHKPMTGGLLVTKYTKYTPKVYVVKCDVVQSTNGCSCLLGVGIEGGKEEIYTQAKDIDGKKPGSK